ncbi:MAG: hypothetical protein ACIAQZ_13470 [Sedimentisphaeraceae bacterium JB056]
MKQIFIKSQVLLFTLLFLTVSYVSAGAVSYSEDFTGIDGTLPADWVVDSGDIFIDSGSFLSDTSVSSNIRAHYDAAGSLDWTDYTFECDFRTSFNFGSNPDSSSSLYPGVTFRRQDADNAYLVRVRKLEGELYPQLTLGLIAPAGIYWFVEDVMSDFLNPNEWYHLEVICDGSHVIVNLYDEDDTKVASVDTDYPNRADNDMSGGVLFSGSVGVYSVMNSTNYIEFDNFEVTGVDELSIDCSDVLLVYGNAADINSDCYVGLGDFAAIADSWLNCMDPVNTSCTENPWK